MSRETRCLREVRERLRNLSEHLPDADPKVHAFGGHLAGMLKDDLPDCGVPLALEATFESLRLGYDVFTNAPLSGLLVQASPEVYSSLRRWVPEILNATCPEDLAKHTLALYRK